MLNPEKYRSIEGDVITRENVNAQLDDGLMLVRAGGNRWYKMRRGGQTRTWKKSPERIYIPYRYSFNGTGKIEEKDFTWQGGIT